MSNETGISQQTVYLPKWRCEITVVLTPDGPYCLVRELCGVLGIKDAQQQAETLCERAVTAPYMQRHPVRIGKSLQHPWCIHQDAIGYWWGFVNDKRVRPQVAPRLIELQKDILLAAKRCLFGVVDSNAPSSKVIPLDTERRITPFVLGLEDRIGNIEDVVYMPKEDGSDDAIVVTTQGDEGVFGGFVCPNCHKRFRFSHLQG